MTKVKVFVHTTDTKPTRTVGLWHKLPVHKSRLAKKYEIWYFIQVAKVRLFLKSLAVSYQLQINNNNLT